MPVFLNLPTDSRSIELDEYVEVLNSNTFDLSCPNDLIASATYLNRLNNNKEFFGKFILNQLKDLVSFQESNIYGSRVFMLHATTDYFIRAVVWSPLTVAENSMKDFEYDTCHDHDFDILSAGYMGDGYSTRCYTYDSSAVKGILGEEISVIDEGVFTLAEGNIVMYRAKKDIHIQLPPTSLSMSLNLIPTYRRNVSPQFQLDESNQQICRYLHASGTELLVRLAGIVGDENWIELLEQVFKTNPSALVRAFAASSRIQLSPDLTDETLGWVQQDKNPLVRNVFEMEVNKYGSSFDPLS